MYYLDFKETNVSPPLSCKDLLFIHSVNYLDFKETKVSFLIPCKNVLFIHTNVSSPLSCNNVFFIHYVYYFTWHRSYLFIVLFQVGIVNPTGGADVDVGSTITVNIQHSDQAYGVFQFENSSTILYVAEPQEEARTVRLKVCREE